MYWGCGEAGKTTNFERLQEIFAPYKISHGFSIATTDERTLWNDSVHFKFSLASFNLDVIVNVATTTGQERFLSTREYVLQNADGVIFVADSSLEKMDNNLRSFEELKSFIHRDNIPILIQLNKRDLDDAVKEDKFRRIMRLPLAHKDALGFKIIYPTVAVDKLELQNVKRIFIDMIQKILKQKLVS
nr:ADP-ribosylation factor-like protein [Candidatus Prometheoarchaeum syntrophicum]